MPGSSSTHGARLLLAALWTAALIPAASALERRAPSLDPARPPDQTRIWMRNLVLFPYPDVPVSVSELSGTVRPTREGRPVTLDDVSSYEIPVEHAAVTLSARDMTILMDRHILPIGHSPIKHVDVSFNEGSISMSGTMVKVGVPVPFTATATIVPTQEGDMRVHITAMHAGDIVPKGIMDALGLKLSNIAQPANRRAFHLEGDDMVVPLVSMFPPPLFLGRLSAVRVTPSGLLATIGQPGGSELPDIQAKSFLLMRGGTVVFAKKLTMRDADMAMVPLDPQRDLGFSPEHYYQQMVEGETRSRPDYALVAHVKDFRDLGSGR
jgi:hypothetical protein